LEDETSFGGQKAYFSGSVAVSFREGISIKKLSSGFLQDDLANSLREKHWEVPPFSHITHKITVV